MSKNSEETKAKAEAKLCLTSERLRKAMGDESVAFDLLRDAVNSREIYLPKAKYTNLLKNPHLIPEFFVGYVANEPTRIYNREYKAKQRQDPKFVREEYEREKESRLRIQVDGVQHNSSASTHADRSTSLIIALDKEGTRKLENYSENFKQITGLRETTMMNIAGKLQSTAGAPVPAPTGAPLASEPRLQSSSRAPLQNARPSSAKQDASNAAKPQLESRQSASSRKRASSSDESSALSAEAPSHASKKQKLYPKGHQAYIPARPTDEILRAHSVLFVSEQGKRVTYEWLKDYIKKLEGELAEARSMLKENESKDKEEIENLTIELTRKLEEANETIQKHEKMIERQGRAYKKLQLESERKLKQKTNELAQANRQLGEKDATIEELRQQVATLTSQQIGAPPPPLDVNEAGDTAENDAAAENEQVDEATREDIFGYYKYDGDSDDSVEVGF